VGNIVFYQCPFPLAQCPPLKSVANHTWPARDVALSKMMEIIDQRRESVVPTLVMHGGVLTWWHPDTSAYTTEAMRHITRKWLPCDIHSLSAWYATGIKWWLTLWIPVRYPQCYDFHWILMETALKFNGIQLLCHRGDYRLCIIFSTSECILCWFCVMFSSWLIFRTRRTQAVPGLHTEEQASRVGQTDLMENDMLLD